MSGSNIPLMGQQPIVAPARRMQTNPMAATQAALLWKQQFDQNKIRDVLKEKDAVDPESGAVSENAITKIMAINPQYGQVIQSNNLKSMFLNSQLSDDIRSRGNKIADEAASIYQDKLTELGPEGAQKAAQDYYDQELGGWMKSGAVPADIQKGLPRGFDISRVQARQAAERAATMRSPQGMRMQMEAQEFGVRERDTQQRFGLEEERLRNQEASTNRGTLTQAIDPQNLDANGNPTPFLYNNRTGKAQTFSGEPYTPKGGAKMPTTPTAGSTNDERLSILKDIQAQHPDWSPSQVAQDSERQMAIAKTGMDETDIDKTAKGIAAYQEAPLTNFALSRGVGPKIMSRVMELNPDYQSARFGEVNRAMTQFSTGKQGDTVRSLNVAAQHLDVFDRASRALGNGDVRALNSLSQTFEQQFGSAVPTTFDGMKQIIGTEIEKAVAGGVGAEADRDRLMKALDRTNSPAQLQGVISSFKSLMAGQAQGLKKQYEDATGFKDGSPFSFDSKLLPATRDALGNLSGERSGASAPVGGDENLPTASTPEEARRLPPGTRFRGPGGRIGTVPGGSARSPSGGP